MVAEHLEAQGFTIIARNARIGRLELDLVAERAGLLVVCEVRTRTTNTFGAAVETINRDKQLRIRRAAATWLRDHPSRGQVSLRFDAAGVLCAPGRPPEIDYYEDAF